MAFQLPNYTVKTPATNTGTNPPDVPLTDQDQANIRWLLNPTPNTNESDTSAAQANIAAGLTGGSAAAASTLRFRDSELAQRFAQGHAILEPYTQRTQQASLQSEAEKARLNEIAQQGHQAMEQLKLQEQGLATRQSEAEQARLTELAQQGQQAMAQLQQSQTGTQTLQSHELAAELQRLGITEAGTTSRQESSIAASAAQQQAEIAARLEIARREGDLAAQRQLQQEAAQLAAQTQAEAAALREQQLRGTQASDLARQQAGAGINQTLLQHYLPAPSTSGGGGGTGTHGGGGGITPPSIQAGNKVVPTDSWGNPTFQVNDPIHWGDPSVAAAQAGKGNGSVGVALQGLSSVQSLLRQYGIT